MNTGLRTKELRLASVGDLDRVSWTIVVKHPKGEGKYGQERIVPILPRARGVLVRYLTMRAQMISKHMPMNDALFPALRDSGDGRFSNNGMLCLKKIVETEAQVRLDFRACRRTFGQMCLDSGVNVESVYLLLGHTTTKTTEGYYCRKRDDVALKGVLEVFESKKPQSAVKPLIENDIYLSGYA